MLCSHFSKVRRFHQLLIWWAFDVCVRRLLSRHTSLRLRIGSAMTNLYRVADLLVSVHTSAARLRLSELQANFSYNNDLDYGFHPWPTSNWFNRDLRACSQLDPYGYLNLWYSKCQNAYGTCLDRRRSISQLSKNFESVWLSAVRREEWWCISPASFLHAL